MLHSIVGLGVVTLEAVAHKTTELKILIHNQTERYFATSIATAIHILQLGIL